ncbi:MAG TPA: hypothetical protein VF844_04525 [Ktedonobacteraceae bacterium]
MQRRAISARLPVTLTLWNPEPLYSVDAIGQLWTSLTTRFMHLVVARFALARFMDHSQSLVYRHILLDIFVRASYN